MTAARVDEDAQYEAGLRPRTLDDYIGQDRVRENLQVAIAAARQRGEALDHVLLLRSAGSRQDDARLRDRATRLGVPVRATSGPAIEKPGDLVGIVTNLAPARSAVHRRDPPDVAGDRRNPLSGARGLRSWTS